MRLVKVSFLSFTLAQSRFVAVDTLSTKRVNGFLNCRQFFISTELPAAGEYYTRLKLTTNLMILLVVSQFIFDSQVTVFLRKKKLFKLCYWFLKNNTYNCKCDLLRHKWPLYSICDSNKQPHCLLCELILYASWLLFLLVTVVTGGRKGRKLKFVANDHWAWYSFFHFNLQLPCLAG